MGHKIPISTLVLVYTRDLRRAADRARRFPRPLAVGHRQPGARRDAARDGAPASCAKRPASTRARTGGLVDWQLSNVYEIYPQWRHRYPPGTTRNTEHVFALEVAGRRAGRARAGRAPAVRMAAVGGSRGADASRGRTATRSCCCRSGVSCASAERREPSNASTQAHSPRHPLGPHHRVEFRRRSRGRGASAAARSVVPSRCAFFAISAALS